MCVCMCGPVWGSCGRVAGRCNEIGKGDIRQEEKYFRNKSLRNVGQDICYIR